MNTLIEQPQSKSVSLYFREGSSDKEYHVSLEPGGDGFVVNFAYGRRGSTLQTGTKTNSPVDYDEAVKIFEKLVNEKMAKGYTEGPNGTPYAHTGNAERVSGLLPQLLNAIDEEQAARLISDPKWCLQEKKNGRRLLLRTESGLVEGINRKGLVIALPQSIVHSAAEIPGYFTLDGEGIGERLHVFDLLILNGEDLRPLSYRQRYTALLNLVAGGLPKHIQVVPAFSDPMDKAAWLRTFKQRKAEGIVLKHLDAPYTAGRPNSGGTQLKYKFCATLSGVVAKVNARRSVQLRLLNHEGWIPVGNVTIPPNQRIPKVGAVVEVRYLYAYPDGSLYQPVYLGERTDIVAEECVMSQLKFKPDNTDEEES
ncbi:MAG TPA: WGR domain-containing protein [Verrucomicrobiae bacterium]|jgi:bifunctional non-homologous end joining protein LigD